MIIHVVSAGETIWQIANSYSVPINSIIQLNALSNPDQLVIGQSLVIPSPYTTHIVKRGDTLWSISQQYGVTMQSIITENHLTNPDVLTPGTRLIIPPTTHIVLPGETLSQIATQYGTTVQAIVIENEIPNPNMIYAGTHLIIPRAKPSIEVVAYSYQESKEAVQSINAIGHLLTYFSPFAYMVKEDGTLQPLKDQEMIDAAVAKNITPMLTLTNFSSTETGSNLSHVILSSAELREKVINNTLQVMQEKGYKVLNVDFENVLPADRENYNTFLQLAVDRLHPKGYLVSTALAPKTSATQAGTLYEAHDYEAHGRIADFVILMTYEWGYRLGPPQAISPINEMRKVVEYALSVIPANKIFLGFEIYARDWLLPHVKGQEAETFSSQEAINRAIKHGATIQYDRTAQSPYFRYVDEQGKNHEVWFEDARSAQAKFDMTKEYNLRGISYWALGFPFPQNWALLNNDFSIKKVSL
ncbi:LysM peptidoglycan-binding domain-containing protein [Lysinibacillus xylanilyticus]|uniref:LysM peptidoglycan-binding domain-containing protein n=1 Tax=Lysinibacillus xylanilyticus TaxID=582475 RepID=A0ABT4EPF4_9BACI|nr:LysM peptidoglycan-binding domain-containing protein [Lysinibacillus xylanilyticus]MCY9547537.1 LysM peptidoglycan-binding domain-containing protein [Lysinibacillus xylanilyticus]